MKNIFKSFVPWILFFAFFGKSQTSKEIASIAALVSHIYLNRDAIKKHFVLDIGTLIFFVLFAMNLFVFKNTFIINNGNLISSAVIAFIAWVSITIKRPFTLQYAREAVTPEVSSSKLFIMINYILTMVWAIIFTLMMLPSLLKFSTVVNMVITGVFLLVGVVITQKFPKWFVNQQLNKKFNVDIKKLFREKNIVKSDYTEFNANKILSASDVDADVVIVGAGPVGLSSALLLQQFGIKTIVIEKHPSVSIHPKARSISCRSMELFRKLGVEVEIAQHSLSKSYNWFGWFSQLTGKLYARIIKDTDYSTMSPTDEKNVAQSFLEAELLEKFQKQGGNILFHSELIGFSQNADRVQIISKDRNTQIEKCVQAKYLIAADGAHSTIRQLLHIPMIGPDQINTVFSVYCEIDLENILEAAQKFSVGFIVRPGKPAPVALPIDGQKKWVFVFPSGDASVEAMHRIYTDEYIKKQISDVVGKENLSIHIISKNVYSLGAQIANQFKLGRAFLVGDSAHRLPPTGGMGMNTGLQDANNLMWKLAFTIQEKINVSILDTYFQERLPPVLDVMEWSLNNLKRIVRVQKEIAEIGIDKIDFQAHVQQQEAHLNKSGLDLGVVYCSDIISKADEKKPSMRTDEYIFNAYPGARLPHFELAHDGKIISSLDLISTEFLFLHDTVEHSWLLSLDFKSIPTKVMLIPELKKLLHLHKNDALWIRPDGHIAWKGCLDNLNDVKQLEEIVELMAV